VFFNEIQVFFFSFDLCYFIFYFRSCFWARKHNSRGCDESINVKVAFGWSKFYKEKMHFFYP